MKNKSKTNIYINVIKAEGGSIDGRKKPMTERLFNMIGQVSKFGKIWDNGGWIKYDENKHEAKPVAKISTEAAELVAKEEVKAQAPKAKEEVKRPQNPNAKN